MPAQPRATGDGVPTRTGRPSRRQVLVSGGVVVAAAGLTTGCGSSGARSTTGPGGATTLSTSEVPVGGGVVLQDRQVVVTQPTQGTFKAFTAVCTHQGCLVTDVANGTITCPCHMGLFSATDGSVQGGPPPAPLAEVPVTVSGTTITLA